MGKQVSLQGCYKQGQPDEGEVEQRANQGLMPPWVWCVKAHLLILLRRYLLKWLCASLCQCLLHRSRVLPVKSSCLVPERSTTAVSETRPSVSCDRPECVYRSSSQFHFSSPTA